MRDDTDLYPLSHEPASAPADPRGMRRQPRTRRDWRQCQGKHRYETRHAAWRAMQSFRRRHPSHYHMSVYWCGGCAYFHCGHDVTRPKETRPC